jgi:DNA-binding XRE family transcriptional regulator
MALSSPASKRSVRWRSLRGCPLVGPSPTALADPRRCGLVPPSRRRSSELGTAGLRLKTIREEKGLTQEEAGERAAAHAKHLGVIEGGQANATFGTLVALAYAYEVSLSAFFEGSPTVR